MTKREIDASAIGRVLNEQVPDELLRKLLPVELGEDAVLRILASVARAVGQYRFWQGGSVQNLQPQEIRDQARATAEIADELLTRLRHMHWEVKALVDADLYRINSDSMLTVANRLEPELLRLRTALERTATNLDKQELPKGRKRDVARNQALRTVFVALREAKRGEKRIGVETARSLAGDLLQLAEPAMPIPTDRDQLRVAMPGK
jgi:hypothetical protein